jgi:hypothetical protein
MSVNLDVYRKKEQGKYPPAIFMHWYIQALDLVLRQSISSLKEYNAFPPPHKFSGVGFSSESRSREPKLFSNFVKKKLPTPGATRCKSTLNLLNRVNEYKSQLFKLLMTSLNIQRIGTLEQFYRHMTVHF